MDYGLIILAVSKYWLHYGYFGLFAGSFLSALFIPLGADILFVSLLAKGFNPWICLFLGTTGGWIGGILIYYIGYAGNKTKIRKWFHIKDQQLEKQKAKIDKYGSLMALLVWVPVIGDLSNVALGFYRINRLKTFSLMYLGRMCRFLFWLILWFIYSTRFVHFFDHL